MTHVAVRAVERGLTLPHFAAYLPADDGPAPPAFDLGRAQDRRALVAWLRSWGCRHLRVADQARSERAVARWARTWVPRLPDQALNALDARDRDDAAHAFDALSRSPAAFSDRGGRLVTVTFGATATAKALFALHPATFPPWDAPIRKGLGLDGTGAGYDAYLELTARLVRTLAARAGIEPDALPVAVGRPSQTAARLIDEYLWRRITRGTSS
jgi:hypothetical protein